jgi:hypothetical protein
MAIADLDEADDDEREPRTTIIKPFAADLRTNGRK